MPDLYLPAGKTVSLPRKTTNAVQIRNYESDQYAPIRYQVDDKPVGSFDIPYEDDFNVGDVDGAAFWVANDSTAVLLTVRYTGSLPRE